MDLHYQWCERRGLSARSPQARMRTYQRTLVLPDVPKEEERRIHAAIATGKGI
jgi:hypothetical protein